MNYIFMDQHSERKDFNTKSNFIVSSLYRTMHRGQATTEDYGAGIDPSF